MNFMNDTSQSSDRFAVQRAHSHIPDAAQRPENVRLGPHRASTSPPAVAGTGIPPQSTYPRSMYFNYTPPHATHKADIFFINPQPTMNISRYDPLHSISRPPNSNRPAAVQSYPTNQPPFFPRPSPTPPLPVSSPPRPPKRSALRQQSSPHVAYPAPTLGSDVPPPPVPPKPFPNRNNTSTVPGPASGAYSETIDPQTVFPNPYVSEASGSEIDEHDLAAALALSISESDQVEERLKELALQEEEELAMALQASMLTASNNRDYYKLLNSEAGPSHWIAYDTSSSPTQESTSIGATSSPLAVEHHLQGLSPSQKPAIAFPEPETAPELITDRLDGESNGIAGPAHSNARSDSGLPYLSSSRSEEPLMQLPVPEHRTPTPTSHSVTGSSSQPISKKEGLVDIPSGGEPKASSSQTETTSATEPSASRPSRESQTPASSSISTPLSIPSTNYSYISEDEALARQLAAEEEAAYHESQKNSSGIQDQDADNHTTPVNPPSHSDSSSRELSRVASLAEFRKNSKSASISNIIFTRNSSVGSSMSTASAPPVSLNRLSQDNSHEGGSTTSEPKPIMARASSTSALPNLHQIDGTADSSVVTPGGSVSKSSALESSARPVSNSGTEMVSSRVSNVGSLNSDHFMNQELLYGVSYGFSAPTMSATLSQMQAPLPGAIALSYGRSSPFHLQAPSWRHILKLMVRLNNARLESTLEALAINKNETLKLRTVVQFVKPHHMSEEWRTILWFTIEHPVPPNTPNAQKYHPTNVNILPWSYTLSTIPTTLKNPFDDMLSKTYTIPATNAVPFPSLPITFSNLALYLQAALDDSRRQPESNSLGRLARMVKTCYPLDFADISTTTPERTSVSGLFKKVIGRGNKSKQIEHGGNEETYDLVTPFVPDEWG